MNPTEWILMVMVTATLCLIDAYAIHKMVASGLYGPGQRGMQVVLILCVPLLGAVLAIRMCRIEVPLFQRPPVDHVGDIDSTCTDIDYHG